ncbi:nuclear pore complex protein Nup62, partial [Lecanoromycetidae sp. Uapishka_2]
MGSSNTSVLFGNTSQDTANPFASLGQTTSTQQPTTSTTAASGGFSDFSLGSGKLQHPPATTSTLFSGFSTGASKPPESPATTSNAQPASIFSSTPNAGGSNLFGSKGGAESTGSLFSNLNKTQDPGATKSNGPQQPQNEISKTSNMFGPGAQLSTKSSTPQTTSASLFGGVASPSATPSAFNSLGKSASSGIATPSTSAPPGGLGDTFTSFGKPAEKASTTGAQSAGTSAPSLMGPPATSNVFGNLGKTAPPATSSLFGDVGKPATSSANSQAPAQPGTSQNLGGANANLGASTAGPAPTAQSRLKNKSMDEIITRWASDLSKYQKEFQQQAEKVAAWDRMLVDNSEKIQRLYGATLEAERATTEVERQLTAVENDQEELSMWLDHYEKDVDAMISNSVGQGDSLSGPDQERERTYQLANKLSERLDDMGKDLGNMIEEINDASSTLSKHSKADDPLTQVVRVLNSHLTQLQQIDQGTAALTLKVKEAQRAGQSMGPSTGLRGPTSDAADGFYRSFMGRR